MAVQKDYFDRRKKSLISPFEFNESEGGRLNFANSIATSSDIDQIHPDT